MKIEKDSLASLQHVAIVMDGNGRWAKEKNLTRLKGHEAGMENLCKIIQAARDANIKYLTLYAFSTENWQRPADEISGLMGLLESFLLKHTEELIKNHIRLRIIGRYHDLPKSVVELLEEALELTKDYHEFNLTLSLSYSSRTEIVDAIKRYTAAVAKGTEVIKNLNWEVLSKYLDTQGIPDPDFIIRTSGEYRMSNFLLLQAAYAEMYFSPVNWPDFSCEHLQQALEFYNCRERRFGKTSEQINPIPVC